LYIPLGGTTVCTALILSTHPYYILQKGCIKYISIKLNGSIVSGSQPQYVKKAHLYRMEMLGVSAPMFWEVELDVYGWFFTGGILEGISSSVDRSLFLKNEKVATKTIFAGEPWNACLSSLFPLN
jgi:hypothetical protein